MEKNSDAWAISVNKLGTYMGKGEVTNLDRKLLTLFMDGPQKPPEPRAQPC